MKLNSSAVILTCCAIAALLAAGPVRADGDVNFIIGSKQLDDGDWGDLDQQFEFGAMISVGPNDWPVKIAVDLIGSVDEIKVTDPTFGDLFTLRGSTYELDLGVRKIWQRGKMRPFLGGGLAAVTGRIEVLAGEVTVSSDATGGGLWIDGGVFWRLSSRFNLGFEGRISRAKIEPDLLGEPVEVQAGGDHFGLTLGWGW